MYKKFIADARADAIRIYGKNCGASYLYNCICLKVDVVQQKVKDAKTKTEQKIAERELHYATIMYKKYLDDWFTRFNTKI